MPAANLVGRPPAPEVGASGDSRAAGQVTTPVIFGGAVIAGRYRLGERVGSGGEGDTFLAVDATTERAVALKIFRRKSAGLGARVRGEFERLVGVDHPGVARALDLGRHDGHSFLVTEWIAGDQSIASIAAVADETSRRSLFMRAARELADALAYLHARGIVHGDVSPQNVRLAPDGRVVLIDLGAGVVVSSAGAVVGTLGFAAPEALIGRVGAGSDLFSLGATLFFAWTGTGPFGRGSEAINKMLAPSSAAPALTDVRGGLPGGWDRLFRGLLQLVPEQRVPSARAVLREIDLLVGGGNDEIPAAGPPVTASALLPPHPAGDPLAGIFVGRSAERELLKTAADALAEGAASHAAIFIVGAEGAGRRSLLDIALRDLAIAQFAESASPIAVYRGPFALLPVWLEIEGAGAERKGGVARSDDDPLRERQRWFATVAAALDRRAAATPVLVALEPGPDDEEFAGFVAGAPATGRWLIWTTARGPVNALAARNLVLPPLGKDDIHALLWRAGGDEPPAVAVQRVATASAGHAATVTILARQLLEAMRRGEGERFAPRAEQALDEMLALALAALSPQARRVIAAVELGLYAPHSDDQTGPGDHGGGTVVVALAREGERAARAAGWLVDEPPEPWASQGPARDHAEGPRLPSVAHQLVLRRALGKGDLRALVVEALAAAPDRLSHGARGYCLEALGQGDAAAAAFLAAADACLRGEDGADRAPGAVGWLEEAARLSASSLTASQLATLATSLALRGRVTDALALLDVGLAAPLTESVSRAAPEPDRALLDRLRLVERKAWLLARGAALEPARQVLQEALAATKSSAGDAPVAAAIDALRARLARVLVSLGRFAEAISCAGAIAAPTGAAAGPSPAGLLAAESAILAHAYGGDLAAARRLHAVWSASAQADRAAYIAALLDHLGGDLHSALATYRLALPQAEASGDIHTLAAIALNMGAVAAESGHYDEALAMQDRAIRELGRLGATAELATALFNAGMTLLELGDLSGARALVARLSFEGTNRPSSNAATASLRYLEGELAIRQGELEVAADLFAQASTAVGLDGVVRRAALIARSELLAARPGVEGGQANDAASEGAAVLDGLERDEPSPRAAAELRLARARILLAAPAVALDEASRVAAALQTDANDAAREGRRPRAWRTALTAARLFHRAGKVDLASGQLVAARRLFEEVCMSIPVDHQNGIEHDPDARFLKDMSRLLASPGDDAADGTRAAGASRSQSRSRSQSEDRLRRLLRINKRLNSELRLPRLLEVIMDTIIELTEAERGFILLEDDKGELTVKVARNIDQQTLEAGAFEVSRSIARQAAAGGRPIVTIDAAGDPRFREALSVSDLHLRSVLAVPLQTKGRSVGTLYVDNRLRKGAFDDDDVQLVLDFAEQAGIAIGNARLLAELRRRERQIEVLNRRLQGELAMRKEELVGMKQELRENREALAIRYDYRNIIGRTPRMLDLFRLLDRLTDTTLPVVIQGESGTGKELVARALHFNGPRRDRPFVSENCAAIPETLLESTLFGAVRGAYTGADHDSRGLFEVADGGTLFLDEVGEMSPAMQGKLLRVLQAGELRRVGSERTRKVDVRLVAATNRDLGRMVEDGRFRQDLFFRLSVAPISLPPLRDRREDIPAIVEHVLKKLAAAGAEKKNDSPKRITAAALSRLAAYRWPGNVRELENELMRAAALSDGHIDVSDLSPHIAGEAEAAMTTLEDPDSLALRPRVERLERALLREALSRSGGNQTRAAVALGLSRFGLQKKIQRYQIG